MKKTHDNNEMARDININEMAVYDNNEMAIDRRE